MPDLATLSVRPAKELKAAAVNDDVTKQRDCAITCGKKLIVQCVSFCSRDFEAL